MFGFNHIMINDHIKKFHAMVFDNMTSIVRKCIIKVHVDFVNLIDFVANLRDNIIIIMISCGSK